MKPSQTTTWLFEEGTFVPNGKLIGEESFSIQSNYLGTPEVMYAADGKVVWSAELDAYGDVQELTGERTDCPFAYQGMYFDKETNLCYNRYRYYSPETGGYLSQDPIRLAGNNPTLYAYVSDPNTWLDPFGLSCDKKEKTPKGGIYVLVDENGVVRRTGRTKDLKKRKADHAKSEELKHLEFNEVYHTDDYDTQRGLENRVDNENVSTANKENGGYNKIKAISDTNKNREEYIEAANVFLK